MRALCPGVLTLCCVFWMGTAAFGAQAGASSRAQALEQLAGAQVQRRLAGVERLGGIGRMQDVPALARALFDDAPEVRAAAEAALWRIWARSGDARIDAMYRRGVSQMNAAQAEEAVATFGQIIRRRPQFAEAWNKRATVLFHLGRYQESLADCDEVLRRNPHHFGALAGYGQIYIRLDRPERALEYFERALAINPNMTGVAMNVEGLRRLLADRPGKAI